MQRLKGSNDPNRKKQKQKKKQKRQQKREEEYKNSFGGKTKEELKQIKLAKKARKQQERVGTGYDMPGIQLDSRGYVVYRKNKMYWWVPIRNFCISVIHTIIPFIAIAVVLFIVLRFLGLEADIMIEVHELTWQTPDTDMAKASFKDRTSLIIASQTAAPVLTVFGTVIGGVLSRITRLVITGTYGVVSAINPFM
ncbi:MAG: hypothetical protein ACTSUE_02515 [Promethearchaeota archaeon]